MARWLLSENDANIDLMSKTLRVSPIFAYVLANRQLRTKKKAMRYLDSDLDQLQDPFMMKDLEKAVQLLRQSIDKREKIVVYGDYDVDGVMSTVILMKALQALDADVSFYIPHREEEGYGLNMETCEKLCEAGYQLVITCDNGISAAREVRFLKEQGVKVIVIDHHEPPFTEDTHGAKTDLCPGADAVVDPKQQLCAYPFKAMCAAGLCYQFVKAIFKKEEAAAPLMEELLVYAALATICDIVDLTEENRVIVKKGLELLNANIHTSIGLQALRAERKLLEKPLSTYHIGFIIGPCINAMGRLESASYAVKLFLSNDPAQALVMAKRLAEMNEERKEMTAKAFAEVMEQAEVFPNDKVLVLYNETIHESIAGIVAGRVKEAFYKPVIVITRSGQMAKGSGRSIAGYNMFQALYAHKGLFERFGGHYMAAGLSLQEKNIDTLRELLNRDCTLMDADFERVTRIDKKLLLSEVSKKLAQELSWMEPFGKGNEEALFLTENVFVERVDFVGSDKTIMQFFFLDENNRRVKGICFDGYKAFKEGLLERYLPMEANKILNNFQKKIALTMDIVYKIEINVYNNAQSVQLHIVDFKFSQGRP